MAFTHLVQVTLKLLLLLLSLKDNISGRRPFLKQSLHFTGQPSVWLKMDFTLITTNEQGGYIKNRERVVYHYNAYSGRETHNHSY